jgi:poly(beta-D-mannuronate) lyase
MKTEMISDTMLSRLPIRNLALVHSLLTAAILFTAPLCGVAATYPADSAADVADLCRSIKPGDTLILADGTYTDQPFVFSGEGTAKSPITLRAETPGKAILTGASTLSISGTHLITDGLLFKDGALDSGSVIEFDSAAQHCVLRSSAIINYNPADVKTRYFWVTLNGFSNIVENCTFSGQAHSGVTVCVRLDGHTAGHIIRRNHFANRPEGNGNGFETIRIGTGGQRMTDARCVVTENLFEECNGEIEIVSNKSCENVYTSNTFFHCVGTLTIRQGNRCKVENNVFIGGTVENSGGLRITGKDHRIANNWFSGIKRHSGGVISLQAGIPGAPKGGYAQVQNCLIDSNTFIDNSGPLFTLDAGYGAKNRELLAEDVTISNTLMVIPESTKEIITAKNPPTGIIWKNNVVVGGELRIAPPAGIQTASAVPADWKARTTPRPLKRIHVGPQWMP